jgi:uncharacterized membrane protein
MTMIGLQLTWAHALTLTVFSILQVHAIVYAVGFKNHEDEGAARPVVKKVLEEAVGVYAIAIGLSAYLLWTFGQISSETGIHAAVDMIVTLGFATSLGAAAGELLI